MVGTAVAALIGALAGLPAGPAAAAIMATGGAFIGNAADLSAADDFNDASGQQLGLDLEVRAAVEFVA